MREQPPPDIVTRLRRYWVGAEDLDEAAKEIERLRSIEAAARQLMLAHGFGDQNWKHLQDALCPSGPPPEPSANEETQ